jgi:two-component system nitrogen regulation sensor histidine kinase NtrY
MKKTSGNHLPDNRTKDRKVRKRKREGLLMIFIIIIITILALAESRALHFGTDLPVSETILMFILMNINLLLLLFLIFLVFRNLAKLYYDRRHKVAGAQIRTKLLLAFITLSLMPASVLFIFSIHFISNSLAFWFNIPIEQALDNSLTVGRRLYTHIENKNQFFLKKTADQIQAGNLLASSKEQDLSDYIGRVQHTFNLDVVEVYTNDYRRLALSFDKRLSPQILGNLKAEHFRKKPPTEPFKTVMQNTITGEFVKTIATVPFGKSFEAAKAFVVISILIPPDLSESLTSISKGFEEYQQIKLLKKPIEISAYLTLSIVALLVVFCAVWFAFHLAKTITIPIMELVEGTHRVAEGNLDFKINSTTADEIGSLVKSFNKMTRDLNISRHQLALSDRMLREQNTEIEEKRQYMEIVLRNIAAGVISLDAAGFVTTINKSAEKMLHVQGNDILKQSFEKLLEKEHLELAREIKKDVMFSKNGIERPLRLTIDGRPRSFLAYFNALRNDTGQYLGLVMVFDDLTQLEKAQRMLAWREVARRIAHEVKNPLTPITLSAQRLKRKYAGRLNDSVFDECTRTIIEHVELIRNLVNEFAAFARFPTASLRPDNLAEIIMDTIALYKEGHLQCCFNINIQENIPQINIDREQIKRVLINLIDNAISATKGLGIIDISVTHDPILKMIRLEIADNGPGISDEEKTRLFEPYFSTKKAGMGLGLAIVNSIIADHKGMIQIQDHQPRGAKFVIELPV